MLPQKSAHHIMSVLTGKKRKHDFHTTVDLMHIEISPMQPQNIYLEFQMCDHSAEFLSLTV